MSGLLSQALTNAEAAEKQISALTGLPSAAKKVQTESEALIGKTVKAVKQIQETVSSFVSSAKPQLEMALQDLDSTTVLATMKSVQAEASTLQAMVKSASGELSSANDQVDDFITDLSGIESDLNKDKSQLQGQLNTAKDKEDAAKKKYYWLLALGPLGLVGLAAALALFEKWSHEVSDLEHQQSALAADITQLNMFLAATKQLATDFTGLVSKVTAVQNTVDFLAGDVGEIVSDLDQSNPSRIALETMVKASQAEVLTLAQDAS